MSVFTVTRPPKQKPHLDIPAGMHVRAHLAYNRSIGICILIAIIIISHINKLGEKTIKQSSHPL